MLERMSVLCFCLCVCVCLSMWGGGFCFCFVFSFQLQREELTVVTEGIQASSIWNLIGPSWGGRAHVRSR